MVLMDPLICIDMERLILPAHNSHRSSPPEDEDYNVIFHSSAVIGCAPTTPLVDVILYRKNEEGEFIQVHYTLTIHICIIDQLIYIYN